MRPVFVFATLSLLALCSTGCFNGPIQVKSNPQAHFVTSVGEFTVELEPNAAPNTVDNFVQYAASGFYDQTIFERIVPGFVIQGGLYTPELDAKSTNAPIANESQNGLQNLRGTIGMVRGDLPDTATSAFYINLTDNPELDASLTVPGYTVFGTVIDGLDTINAIAAVPTAPLGNFDHLPTTTVTILSVTIIPAGTENSAAFNAYGASVQYGLLYAARDVVVTLLGYGINNLGD